MSYAKALSDRLRTLHAEERTKHEAHGYWYPSQIGGCDRKNVLQHAGVIQTPPDDRSLRLFWMGNQIHAALQAFNPFEVVGHELDVKDETYKLSGRLDTLVLTDGVLEVIELKSLRSDAFQYGLPKPEHIRQVGCYLAFPAQTTVKHAVRVAEWDDPEPGKVLEWGPDTIKYYQPERARLVYWSKDDARVEEFIIPKTDELINDVKGELKRLEGLYQAFKANNTLPDALPADDWRIRGPKVYCDYYGSGQCCADGKAPVRDPVRVGPKKSPKKGDV